MGGSGGQDGCGHARVDQPSVESEGTGAVAVRRTLIARRASVYGAGNA